MRVFKWAPSFDMHREFSLVPVWFSLPSLPVHFLINIPYSLLLTHWESQCFFMLQLQTYPGRVLRVSVLKSTYFVLFLLGCGSKLRTPMMVSGSLCRLRTCPDNILTIGICVIQIVIVKRMIQLESHLSNWGRIPRFRMCCVQGVSRLISFLFST